MKYMLLIYSEPDSGPAPGSPEADAENSAYVALSTELATSGKLVSGEPLQGIDTATSITVRDGKAITTDGPFAETKEILGGYYLIDVPDLDEALRWAAKIPTAAHGTVEVRPLLDFPGM